MVANIVQAFEAWVRDGPPTLLSPASKPDLNDAKSRRPHTTSHQNYNKIISAHEHVRVTSSHGGVQVLMTGVR